MIATKLTVIYKYKKEVRYQISILFIIYLSSFECI